MVKVPAYIYGFLLKNSLFHALHNLHDRMAIFIVRCKTSFGLYVRIALTISRIYSSFIYKPRSGIAKFSLVLLPLYGQPSLLLFSTLSFHLKKDQLLLNTYFIPLLCIFSDGTSHADFNIIGMTNICNPLIIVPLIFLTYDNLNLLALMRALTFQHLPYSLQVESHIHHINEAMHSHPVHAAVLLMIAEENHHI